ncbi:MAG: biotin/lipoyl-containing protein [Clostridia bacterium]
MKKFLIKVNGKEYEVEVEQTGGAHPIVQSVKPAPQPEAAPQKKQEPAAGGTIGSVKITAPMPGTIMSIKKKTGESVAKGEIIMVLEAMKMENEITAPQDGTISSINVSASAAVESGQLLASLA